MYLQILCPSCGNKLTVREELSGRKCGCPHCKKTIQIPTLAGRETPPPSQPSAAEPGGIQIDTKRKRTNPAAPAQTASTSKLPGASHSIEDSTNVGMVLSGLIGAGTTLLFYGVLIPLHQFKWTELFWDRGWVPYVTVLLTFWSFSILFLKWRKLNLQRRAMLLDVLPMELSEEITFDTLDRFLNHIAKLPIDGQSFLINRVVRGIEHFRVRKSTSETVTMLGSQSDIDANNVLGSYTLVKVFIWALPIMGFIGTVIGVSTAIAGLAGSLENASDVSAIKGALNNVFAGLGTAFDTTLLALVLSLMVKVPCSALQKSEEDLITWVDEYCNENLLKRLNDRREGGAQRGGMGTSGVDPNVIRDVFSAAMSVYHDQWNKQVTEMNQASRELQKSFTAISANTSKLQIESLQSGKALQKHFSGLERGLSELSGVLEKLGGQQVVVQQVPGKQRGWFGGKR
jgi:hypothetical protein